MARYYGFPRRRKSARRVWAWGVVLVVAGISAWAILNAVSADKLPEEIPGVPRHDPAGTKGSDKTDKSEIPPPVPPPPERRVGTPTQRARARTDHQKGLQLLAQDEIIQARKVLSKALLSGLLPAKDGADVILKLTELAEKTLFTRKIYPGDGYAMEYTVRRGEVLERVERRLELHVPWQILLKVNRVKDAARIRAGDTLKMIRGPFHALVYKSIHVMDIYLHRKGLEEVFVKRVPVGLGKEGLTPLGSWRIGSKLVHPKYYPAPNSPNGSQPIPYGRPGYAFGSKGLWISLQGTDDKTRSQTGYGLHSTDKPNSVGKNASEGCIRLADKDIDLIFALLYEKWSTVVIKP